MGNFVDDLGTDLTEIHARLMDHRPVVQGNINFFIKEFEDKRGDRELDRLKSLDESMMKVNQGQLPTCQSQLEEHTRHIISKVNKAVEMCDRVGDKEGQIETEFLKQNKADRLAEWETFMQTQFEKSADVDGEFDRQVEILKQHYSDLEEKLKMATS